ncbi:MAG: hypothetical protein JWN14_1570 [Chthonomonadales bacterium]|nr:hypothetical protein [Chthonomonadales bacterium]
MWSDELDCDDGICMLCGELVGDMLEGYDKCEDCLVRLEWEAYERENEKRRPRLIRISREDFSQRRFPASVRRAKRPVQLT